MLDAARPQAADGSAFMSMEEAFTSPRERRWLELHTKHQTALQWADGAEASARAN